MSCMVSQGVVFCQMTPLGFVAVLTLIGLVGAAVDRLTRRVVNGL